MLVKYLKPYQTKFYLGLFFLVVTTLSSLAFPKAMGSLIDAATLAKGYSNINIVALVLMGILFFQAITTFLKVIWFVEVAERSLADLRKDTYFKLVTLPMSFFSQRRVGELNSRISADLSQIQDSITITIAELLRQIITLIGGVIALSLVSVKLTLMMLAIFPVLIAVAVFFGRYIRNIARQSQDQMAESNVIVEETLQGISNVKAFVNEAYETLRYKKAMQGVIKYALKGAKFRGAFSAFIIFCLFGAIVTVVWFGASLVQKGDITVGDLTTFILYATYVGAAMGSFADLYSQLQKTLGATERVIELLDEKNEEISIDVKQGIISQKINGVIEFKNIEFAYPSRKEVEVLKGLSFQANKGEKVAIVGPSGAGKSTIASLLLRFYAPDKGELLFDNRNANDYTLSDIRNQIAIVPQDVLLFGGSIRENISYGKIDATEEEIINAARQANAHDFISSFPEGYDTLVGERGIKLSGGQRQRIAIARALLKNPSILILDEATSSLDSESERLVQEALQVLMKDRTSIIIAHRLSTIREADQIIVIDEGKVQEAGTHQELMNNTTGLYRYLNQLQLQEN